MESQDFTPEEIRDFLEMAGITNLMDRAAWLDAHSVNIDGHIYEGTGVPGYLFVDGMEAYSAAWL